MMSCIIGTPLLKETFILYLKLSSMFHVFDDGPEAL